MPGVQRRRHVADLRRLLALGVTSAILIAACSAAARRPRPRPKPRPRPRSPWPRSPGPVRGTGLRGSVRGAQHRLEGVRRLRHRRPRRQGLQRPRAEGPRGREGARLRRRRRPRPRAPTDYEANIQRLIDAGLPDDRHRRLPAVLGDGRRRRSRTRRSRSGRSTRRGTRRVTTSPRAPPTTTAGVPPTSPASTTRSTRPRCSPATWPRAGARPARSPRTAASPSRASPGSWTACTPASSTTTSRRARPSRSSAGTARWRIPPTTGTFVGGSGGTDTWNDPAKGEQFAKTFLDEGVDIVHPVAGETGNGTIKAMLAAGKWAIGVDNDQAISIPESASRDPHLGAEGHRRLGARRDQEDRGRRPRRRGLLGHARQQRRAPVAVPRLRQPDLGRDRRPSSTR